MDPNNPDHVQVINNAIALMKRKQFLDMDRFYVHGDFPNLTRDEEEHATISCGTPSCLGGYILTANKDRINADDIANVETSMGKLISPLLGGVDFGAYHGTVTDQQLSLLFMPWNGLTQDMSKVDISDAYTPKVSLRDYLEMRHDLSSNDAFALSDLFAWSRIPVEAGIAVLEHFRDTGIADWRVGLDLLDLSQDAMHTAHECISDFALVK